METKNHEAFARYQQSSIELIGQGSFGKVYKGFNKLLNRVEAIKHLEPKGVGGKLDSRVEKEIRIMTELTNNWRKKELGHMPDFKRPNLVEIYDSKFTDNEAFIHMTYIDGYSLKNVIKNGEELPLERSIKILKDIAITLQYVYESSGRKLIHRDIKPENIMISRQDQNAYLMDFGLSREEGKSTHTATGAIVGTPAYLSPEQATGEVNTMDFRSDIYTFGSVMYELFSREHLIHAPTPILAVGELMGRLADGRENESPRSIIAEKYGEEKSYEIFPKEVEDICMRCLRLNREERYQSYDQLIFDLNGCLRKYIPTSSTDSTYIIPDNYFREQKDIKYLKKVTEKASLGVIVVSAILGLGSVYTIGQNSVTPQGNKEKEKLVKEIGDKKILIETTKGKIKAGKENVVQVLATTQEKKSYIDNYENFNKGHFVKLSGQGSDQEYNMYMSSVRKLCEAKESVKIDADNFNAVFNTFLVGNDPISSLNELSYVLKVKSVNGYNISSLVDEVSQYINGELLINDTSTTHEKLYESIESGIQVFSDNGELSESVSQVLMSLVYNKKAHYDMEKKDVNVRQKRNVLRDMESLAKYFETCDDINRMQLFASRGLVREALAIEYLAKNEKSYVIEALKQMKYACEEWKNVCDTTLYNKYAQNHYFKNLVGVGKYQTSYSQDAVKYFKEHGQESFVLDAITLYYQMIRRAVASKQEERYFQVVYGLSSDEIKNDVVNLENNFIGYAAKTKNILGDLQDIIKNESEEYEIQKYKQAYTLLEKIKEYSKK